MENQNSGGDKGVQMFNREQFIQKYFHEGYTYSEIMVGLMKYHGISVSKRHLQRILRQLGLCRKNYIESNMEDILRAVINETSMSGKCLGYKTLWFRLRKTYGLSVKRQTVLELLRLVDPDGIEQRKRRRLLRRKYVVPGPNFIWHVDGYDQLKPFGFCIHGGIDGYSRQILWLKVASTNNDPRVIAHYFLESVTKLKITPTLLRADKGTENVTVGLLQMFFRYYHIDKLSGTKSFIQDKSSANQRIECWWSQMRRMGADWWISFFKDLRDSGVYDDSDPLHIECFRYCFGPLLQCELTPIAVEWNHHKIRKQKKNQVPGGKPNVLFLLPELQDRKDYGKPVSVCEVDICKNLYTKVPEIYNPLFDELLEMVRPGTVYPTTHVEGSRLFLDLNIFRYDLQITNENLSKD